MKQSACACAVILVGLATAVPALADTAEPQRRLRLNDTAATRCVDPVGAQLPSCAGTGQDGEYGRDAMHIDSSDGLAGFRFRRVCNSGEYADEGACPAQPTLGSGEHDWACTADLVTGHIWEVKTVDGGARDASRRYTQNLVPDAGDGSDTRDLIAVANAMRLCGAADWRLPTDHDLISIVNFRVPRPGPTIGTIFFPNTVAGPYWSSTSAGRIGGLEQGPPERLPPYWSTDFASGASVPIDNYLLVAARLVRSVPPPVGNHRFQPSVDGSTVRDKWTRLEWRYCVEGRFTNPAGGPCIGDAIVTDWPGALAAARAAGGGWRLPNIKELDSLLARVRPAPPTLAYTFGDSGPYTLPSTTWWSSTPVTGAGATGWVITVDPSFLRPGTAETGIIRLVRDAPAP